jgi:hypothetical protein
MPVALAAVGVAVSVAGTVAGIAAAQQQAQNTQRADNYNAQVQANNAQVAMWQRQQQEQEYASEAQITQQEGGQQASRLEMQDGALVAKNVAAAASAGLDLSGSTVSAIQGSAANNELEVLNQEHKTQIAAFENQIGATNATYNDLVQSRNYTAQSQLYTMAGQSAAQTGEFSEIGAGISGASRILTSGYSLGETGGLFE